MATTKKLSATNLKATTTLNTTKVVAAAKTISTGVKQVSDIKISTVTEKKVTRTPEFVQVKPIEKAPVNSISVFSASVSYSGGISCVYSAQTAEQITYKLERKKESTVSTKNSDDEWVTIKSSNIVGFISKLEIQDDKVEKGSKYTYRLTIKKLNENKTVTQEATVLYDAVKIDITNFSATIDHSIKAIILSCKVLKANTYKIFRKDNGKVLSDSYVDTDIDEGKTYEYILEASNYWETIQKSIQVNCSGLKPIAEKVSYSIEKINRGVTLKWPHVSNALQFSIKRKLDGTNSWDLVCSKNNACSNPNVDSYTDIDESENEKVLQKDKTYKYMVVWSNEWGESSSEIISIKMTNEAPNTPRILPPNGATLHWTQIGNAKEYYIERTDSPSKFNWTNKQMVTFISDNAAEPGVLYTYKVVARNGWGESRALYCDVKPKKEEKGEIQNRYVYLGQNKNQYKNSDAGKWSLNFQGITTDGTWWYITNGGYCKRGSVCGKKDWHPAIRKATLAQTLDRDISRDWPLPGIDDEVHVGDLDYYKGYLFLPIYKNNENGKIWILKTDKNDNCVHKSDRIATIQLRKKNGTYLGNLAWCAINPCDGRLYVSDGKSLFLDDDNNLDKNYPLYSFKIDLDKIKEGERVGENWSEKEWEKVFTDPQEIYLYDQSGNLCGKASMQGGCFDYYNNLYLNSGCSGTREGQGVHVFKLIRDDSKQLQDKLSYAKDDAERAEIYEAYMSGNLDLSFESTKGVLIAESNQNEGFKYQFDPGNKGDNHYEEPEGMVYCDFTYAERQPPQDHVKDGSLHVGLLLNSTTSYENVCFKHYAHLSRETEEKNVYYNPANLAVVSAVEANDDGGNKTVYKVVDNGILVKKFDSKDHANAALEILKNFEKIHTIGWLYTCSPNHNYEFSVLESNKTLSSSSCTSINYSNPTIIHEDESEFWKVTIKSTQGQMYHFRAHNEEDAKKILEILKRHSKLCYIGVGPDTNNRTLGRFRSANNLIWLE